MVPIRIALNAAGVRLLRAALRPIPHPISARALLDTGAEATCLDSGLVQRLSLPLAGFAPVNLPALGGQSFTPLYRAELAVLHPSGNPWHDLVLHDLNVLDLSLSSLGYEAVIGRDVLAWCRLLYNGPGNRFRLSY